MDGLLKYDTMLYSNETPWHKKGDKALPGESFDDWVKRVVPWGLEKADVLFDANGVTLRYDGQQVVYRTDQNIPLAIVGKGYKIHQPKAVFEILKEMCESGNLKLSTMGTLKNGRYYWVLAEIGKDFEVIPGHKILGNVLLASSCDGKMRTTGRQTLVTVVCWNTLMSALGDDEAIVHSAQSHRGELDADVIRMDLGLLEENFDRETKKLRLLAERELTLADGKKLILELLKVDEEKRKGLRKDSVDALEGLWIGNRMGKETEPNHGETMYGFLQAVTQYVDHEMGEREEGNRLYNAWFGASGALKTRTYEKLLSLVDLPTSKLLSMVEISG